MSIYHFDIADRFPPDPCPGVELAHVDIARQHALRYAGSELADQLPEFWQADEWVMTVSDAQHLTLFTITVMTADAPALGEGRNKTAAR